MTRLLPIKSHESITEPQRELICAFRGRVGDADNLPDRFINALSKVALCIDKSTNHYAIQFPDDGIFVSVLPHSVASGKIFYITIRCIGIETENGNALVFDERGRVDIRKPNKSDIIDKSKIELASQILIPETDERQGRAKEIFEQTQEIVRELLNEIVPKNSPPTTRLC